MTDQKLDTAVRAYNDALDYVENIRGFDEKLQGKDYFVVRDLNAVEDGLGKVLKRMTGVKNDTVQADSVIERQRAEYIVSAVMKVNEREWREIQRERAGSGGGMTMC